jgi:hypothetical protein
MPSKANIEISLVPWALIPSLWPKIARHVTRGAEIGGVGLEMQLERLMHGLDVLWVIAEGEGLQWRVLGTFVTTICQEDDGRRFVGVSNLSGDRPRAWCAMMSEVTAAYARAQGCGLVRCYGRPAWGRLLPREISIVGSHENGHAIFERAA